MEDKNFDRKLETYDWRYSAAALGLIKFFEYHDPLQEHYRIDDDFMEYDSSFLTKENYFEFVEYYYGDKLHHVFVEKQLKKKEFSDDDIKLINDKLSGNTIMKKIFKKVKFDGTNKEEILSLISENRMDLICETFRNKNDMYKNYCNTNQLFNESQKFSRLNGYYIDAGKKGKSTGFAFDMDTFVGQDELEFDFIPFAFLGDNVSFFINDNYTLDRLELTNKIFQDKINTDLRNQEYRNKKSVFFKTIIESTKFIDYDVEVIIKDWEKDYFETLYIRKQSINILRNIKDYKCFCFYHKVNDNYYIDVQSEVINCIFNNTLLDLWIEFFIKDERNYHYLVKQMINVNISIKEVSNMSQNSNEYNVEMYKASKCAEKVVENLEENKLKSYRQKLISALSFKDYDRVCQLLLNLSQYTGIYFNFTYKLFEDFEANKEIAYVFINDLNKPVLNKTKKEDK